MSLPVELVLRRRVFLSQLITSVVKRIAEHRRGFGEQSGAVASFGAASRGNVHLAKFASKLG